MARFWVPCCCGLALQPRDSFTSEVLQGACARAWQQMRVSKTPLPGAAVEELLPCDGQYLFHPSVDLSLLFSPQLVVLGPRRSRLALEPRGMGWMKPLSSGCL